jgi:iron(III) transport system substrate-binding protein
MEIETDRDVVIGEFVEGGWDPRRLEPIRCPSCGSSYPAGGTVLIPSPIAITADSGNPTAARAVVDFLLSQPGQQIIVQIGNFYPVRTDVAPPPGAPSLDLITVLDIDWSTLPAEIDSIMATWESLFAEGPEG